MTILTSRAIATAAAAAIAFTTMSLTPADAKVRYHRVHNAAVALTVPGTVVIITKPRIVRHGFIGHPGRFWHRRHFRR